MTLCPHCDEGEPEELIVPLGAIREIRIGVDGGEQRSRIPARGARLTPPVRVLSRDGARRR